MSRTPNIPAVAGSDHSFETNWKSLSKQERKIAELVAFGFSAEEIARIRGRTRKTVEVQRCSILRKMECENSVSLTRAYWCHRMRQELQEEMQPVILRRKYGSGYVYYLGFYNQQGRPETTIEQDKAAVFAGIDAVTEIQRRLNSQELINGNWEAIQKHHKELPKPPEVSSDFFDGEEHEFIPCDRCDGHDACADFGCAIDSGLGHLVKTDPAEGGDY